MINSQLKKSALSEPEQRLIKAMQTIDFGWLHDVHVKSGRPTFTPAPKAVRDLKLGAGQGARPELNKSDFVLKSEVIELFKTLREVHNGVVAIECRQGLPARVRYELEGAIEAVRREDFVDANPSAIATNEVLLSRKGDQDDSQL